MQGILSLSETFLMMCSWARGAGAGWKLAVRRILQAFLRAEDADQFLGLVVVGRQVVVGDGPVEAFAVAAVRLEIVGAHAQRDAAVVVGAAAQHARAIPHELAARRAGVGFAGDLPAAHQRGVVVTEGLLLGAGGAMRSVVVPLEHVALLGRVVVGAGFQHADFGAGEREHVRGDAAARSGAHYDDIIRFRTGFDLRQWRLPRNERHHFTGPKAKKGGRSPVIIVGMEKFRGLVRTPWRAAAVVSRSSSVSRKACAPNAPSTTAAAPRSAAVANIVRGKFMVCPMRTGFGQPAFGFFAASAFAPGLFASDFFDASPFLSSSGFRRSSGALLMPRTCTAAVRTSSP